MIIATLIVLFVLWFFQAYEISQLQDQLDTLSSEHDIDVQNLSSRLNRLEDNDAL